MVCLLGWMKVHGVGSVWRRSVGAVACDPQADVTMKMRSTYSVRFDGCPATKTERKR